MLLSARGNQEQLNFANSQNISQSAQDWMGYLHDLPDTYQNSQKRFLEIRNKCWDQSESTHSFDRLLSRPEASSWKSIRILVVTARNCEVGGEFFADMSHAFDKITRNTLSNGKDTDFVRMGSAVMAKYIARTISHATLGAPKFIGAFLFGLSCILSASALVLRQIENRNDYPNAIRLNPLLIENTPIHELEIKSQKKKNKIVETIYNWAEHSDWAGSRGYLKATARYLHRSELGVPSLRNQASAAGYMFRNSHQYKGRTALILRLSKLSFNMTNKLLASPDKYIAYLLGSHMLAKFAGELLGMRIAFLLTTAAAFLVSFFAAPVMMTILNIAAVAALIAALLLLIAQLDVVLFGSWRGDLQLA